MAAKPSVLQQLALPLIVLMLSLAGVKLLKPRQEARLVPKRAARVELAAALQRLQAMDPGQVASLRAGAAADRHAITEFETHIPEQEGTAALLRTIEERATALNLRVGDVLPLASSPLAPPSVSPYVAAMYTVTVKGAWVPTVQFLDDLTTADPLTLPTVEWMRADTTGALIETRLVLTLVSKTGHAAAPGKGLPLPATPPPLPAGVVRPGAVPPPSPSSPTKPGL